jgi:hypothetical protein
LLEAAFTALLRLKVLKSNLPVFACFVCNTYVIAGLRDSS